MTAQHQFEIKLADSWPPQTWRDVTVLIAVSGGPDSIALLAGLAAIRQMGAGRLVVVHFDHRLRDESRLDREFVQAAAADFGCESEIRLADSPTLSQGDGVEAAARDARYAFFRDAACRWGARFLVTGHTADDQVETILHRLMRGTGLRGAAGIPRARALLDGVSLLRPMLEIDRQCVMDYLASRRQAFRTDETNADPSFLRNRIRHELLPLLATYQPGVSDSLQRFGHLARASVEVLDELVRERLEGVFSFDDEGVSMDVAALRATQPHLARLMLQACWSRQKWPERDMNFEKWESLRDAIATAGDNRVTAMLPGAIRLTVFQGVARLARQFA